MSTTPLRADPLRLAKAVEPMTLSAMVSDVIAPHLP